MESCNNIIYDNDSSIHVFALNASSCSSDIPHVTEIGGKAHSLMKINSLSLPVPPGIVLPVSFFSTWQSAIKQLPEWQTLSSLITTLSSSSSPNQLEQTLTSIKSWCTSHLILSPQHQQQLTSSLQQHIPQHETTLYAIRSSSPNEDLSSASFAGLYETYLGIKYNDMHTYILNTFLSCLDIRLLQYKLSKQFDPLDISIAIIIMKQLHSSVSGVAFSLNPITNDFDEVFINSNFGLGESIVKGVSTPDCYIINKHTCELKETKISNKTTLTRLTHSDGVSGTVDEEVPQHQRTAQSLSLPHITQLTTFIKQLETAYNNVPLDIEFAIEHNELYLLQVRPITTYCKLPKDITTLPSEQRQLYLDITLVIQGFSKPISLLSIETLASVINKIALNVTGTYDFLNVKNSVIGVCGGKIIANLSNLWTKLPKATTRNFFQNISTVTSNIISQLKEDEYVNKEVCYKIDISPLGMLWRIPVWRMVFYNWFAKSTVYYFNYYADDVEKISQQYERDCISGKISFEYAVEQMGTAFAKFFSENVTSVIYNVMASFVEFKGMFKQYENDVSIADDLHNLLKCLPYVTIQQGIELYKLSQMLMNCNKYREMNVNEFIHQFNTKQLPTQFYEMYEVYMNKYGFRCEGELDMANPRNYEQPEVVLNQIHSMIVHHDDNNNPLQHFETEKHEHPRRYERLKAFAKANGFENKFVQCYQRCMTYLPYRESMKYYVIRLLGHFKKMILHYTKEVFIKRGLINDINDIWKLSLTSFKTILKDPSRYNNNTVRDIIKRDQVNHELFNAWTRTPAVFDSRGKFFQQQQQDVTVSDGKDVIYRGESVSWGCYKGKAKVMRKCNEKEFIAGEILVTKATDPGWTPLILQCGAIVLEVGGMLQHGALVAREFNKPCVVGVDNVMELIKDGDEIEVDAVNGVVKLIK